MEQTAKRPTLHDVLEQMQSTGGGYVKALSVAYMKADNENRQLLQPALDKYYAEFERAIIAQRKERRAP